MSKLFIIFFSIKTTTPEGLCFRLMSYNVLAQNLLESNPQLYRKHERFYLAWENRWAGIKAEVIDFNPDIVCLQVSSVDVVQVDWVC